MAIINDTATAINELQNEIEALKIELGVNPGGVYADARVRLDILEARINNPFVPAPNVENPFFIGNDGVTISTGFGEPTEDRINGSLYLRQDGYVNEGLYARRDGYWTRIDTAAWEANGDLFGVYNFQTVVGLQNRPVSAETPLDGYHLTWNDSSSIWEPQIGFHADKDLSGDKLSQTVIGLQGRLIDDTQPLEGYVLTWNDLSNKWQPQPTAVVFDTFTDATNIRSNRLLEPSIIDNTKSGIVNLGSNSIVSANYATISGGLNNECAYDKSFIGGGEGNNIAFQPPLVITWNFIPSPWADFDGYSVIVGGLNNSLSSTTSCIVSGILNNISNSPTGSIVSGAQNNIDSSAYCNITHGLSNTIQNQSELSGIFNGYLNQINYSALVSITSGAYNNITNSLYSSIINGYQCTLNNDTATLSNTIVNGFYHSIINSSYSSILNGYICSIDSGDRSLILNGTNNILELDASIAGNPILSAYYNPRYSSILNGFSNKISGPYSTILSGFYNTLDGYCEHAIILGGTDNIVSKSLSTIVFGTSNNVLESNYSNIIGNSNTANSEYTRIFGSTNTTNDSEKFTDIFGENNNIYSSASYAKIFGYSNNVNLNVKLTKVFGYSNEVSTTSPLKEGLSSITGKQNNLTGDASSIHGFNNTVYGDHAHILGENNSVGSIANTVNYSVVHGYNGSSKYHGQYVHAGGDFNLPASSAQYSRLIVDGYAEAGGEFYLRSFGNNLEFEDGKSYDLTIRVLLVNTNDTPTCARYVYDILAHQESGSLVIDNFNNTILSDNGTGWTITITTVSNQLSILVDSVGVSDRRGMATIEWRELSRV